MWFKSISLGMCFVSLTSLVLHGASCDYCCSNFTLSEPPYAEPKSKKEIAVLKAQGGVAYEEYGEAWHSIRYRSEFTAAQWKTILLQKRIRVPLTAEDQRALSQLFVGE